MVNFSFEGCGGPVEDRCFGVVGGNCLSPLATDTAGQLDVLGHDGHTLGVDSAQVGVLEETHKVSLTGLLQSHDSRALEAQVSLEVLGDLTDKTLEGQLADEKLSALLVTTDLTKSHSSRPVPVGLLHTSGGWGTLASGLGGQLLARSLSSSRFTGCLLGSCHCNVSHNRIVVRMKFSFSVISFIASPCKPFEFQPISIQYCQSDVSSSLFCQTLAKK